MRKIVIDVGNTRVKWGLCTANAVSEVALLPPDEPEAWRLQREAWQSNKPTTWVATGVHPARRGRLVDWLRAQGETVVVLDDWQKLPLRINLERPGRAGIDRLLDAVAVNARRQAATPAIVIDAGSAVTVDWIDGAGAFCGGAIFPGARLMAVSLNNYTALLPLIQVTHSCPSLPGKATPAAMEAGIFWAVAGGIRAIATEMARNSPVTPHLFLTGGDTELLRPGLGPNVVAWPEMTLEGIRLAAETIL